MKKHNIDRILVVTLSFLLGTMCIGATNTSQSTSANANAVEKGTENDIPKINIPDFTTIDDAKAESLRNKIQEQRMSIGDSLVLQLENNYEKLTNTQTSVIIDTLGALRYTKAVPILIKNLNFERIYIPKNAVKVGELTVGAMSPLQPYIDQHPANTALIEIGDPASKYILLLLDKKLSDLSTKDYLSSRIDGIAEVLFHIEGSRYGLLKLEDYQKTATDPQVKAQYQMVIDQFKKIVARTQ